MNKKIVATGLSIAIGSSLLITTAFASNTTSGYDSYKSAIKNTLTAKNLTENATITLKDNGNVIATVDDTAKLGIDSKTASVNATINAAGQTTSIESYKQDGQSIFKSSDSSTYDVKSETQRKRDTQKNNPSSNGIDSTKLKDGEMLLDALVGNLQNYVTLNNSSDGSKTVSVQLSDGQLPAAVNAAASILVKNVSNRSGSERFEQDNGDISLLKNVTQNMPKLVDNIRIDNVNLNAQIDKDNNITQQIIDITISGKDANGADHIFTADINMNLSQFNSTTPDKIDLTGKQVNTISSHKEFSGKKN